MYIIEFSNVLLRLIFKLDDELFDFALVFLNLPFHLPPLSIRLLNLSLLLLPLNPPLLKLLLNCLPIPPVLLHHRVPLLLQLRHPLCLLINLLLHLLHPHLLLLLLLLQPLRLLYRHLQRLPLLRKQCKQTLQLRYTLSLLLDSLLNLFPHRLLPLLELYCQLSLLLHPLILHLQLPRQLAYYLPRRLLLPLILLLLIV